MIGNVRCNNQSSPIGLRRMNETRNPKENERNQITHTAATLYSCTHKWWMISCTNSNNFFTIRSPLKHFCYGFDFKLHCFGIIALKFRRFTKIHCVLGGISHWIRKFVWRVFEIIQFCRIGHWKWLNVMMLHVQEDCLLIFLQNIVRFHQPHSQWISYSHQNRRSLFPPSFFLMAEMQIFVSFSQNFGWIRVFVDDILTS